MPFLTFFGLHEQDIKLVENLKQISAINLSKSTVSISQNSVIVNDLGKAKIHYKLELAHQPYVDPKNSANFEEQSTIFSLKTYGDFKRLYALI